MSNPNWPTMKVWVNFADPGALTTDPVPFYPTNPNWVDITKYCKRIGDGQLLHTERGRNYERSQTDSGTMTLTLDNSTGAFDPTNTASPFYPNVKQIRKVQVTATWAGTTYYLWHGRIEDWPRVWKSAGFWGEVTATARGILASLATIDLVSPWVNEAVLDGATAIYRCNDPSGSVSAANSSPFQQLYAPIQIASGTTTDSKFSFGDNPGAGNLAGDPTDSLTLAPEITSTGHHGYYLQTATSADDSANLFFPATGGWSWEAWVLIPAAIPSYTNASVFSQKGPGTAAAGTDAQIDIFAYQGDGNFHLSITNAAFSGVGFGNPAVDAFDGNWHHLVATMGTDGKTGKLYVDGVVATQAAGSTFSFDSSPNFQTVGMAFQKDASPAGAVAAASLSVKNLAWYPTTVLTQTQVNDHFAAGQGYLGDDTGARIARILDYTPYPYRQLDLGNSTLGRMNVEGTNTVQAIENANDTEVGTIIETGDGYVEFKNRQSRNPLNASLTTFGETGAPYQDDLTIQRDPALIFTDVVVARDLGITITTVDTAAEQDYFPRTLSMNSSDVSDQQAIGLSQYLLEQYKVGRDRIATLTIVPSANPTLWPVALGRDIGDRVTVRRANPAAGSPLVQDFYIEKVTHDVSTGNWRTTYMMSTSALWDTTFILDDSTYGVLDTSKLGF